MSGFYGSWSGVESGLCQVEPLVQVRPAGPVAPKLSLVVDRFFVVIGVIVGVIVDCELSLLLVCELLSIVCE